MFAEERRKAKWDTRYTRAGGKACVAVVAVVCGSGRGGAVFQTPRWGIDFGPGRWHRRGTPSRGHRDVVVASVAAALLPPPPLMPNVVVVIVIAVVAGSERARRTTHRLYLSRQPLACSSAN